MNWLKLSLVVLVSLGTTAIAADGVQHEQEGMAQQMGTAETLPAHPQTEAPEQIQRENLKKVLEATNACMVTQGAPVAAQTLQ